jgi:hypothetical protein
VKKYIYFFFGVYVPSSPVEESIGQRYFGTANFAAYPWTTECPIPVSAVTFLTVTFWFPPMSSLIFLSFLLVEGVDGQPLQS